MGMDLVPRYKDGVETFHVNWTGWRTIGDLLEQLGCDLSEMQGSNDGALIKAKTCRAWAKAIKKALNAGKISTKRIEDKLFLGGFYETFQVVEKDGQLSQDDQDFLNEFFAFLNNCSGCRQF